MGGCAASNCTNSSHSKNSSKKKKSFFFPEGQNKEKYLDKKLPKRKWVPSKWSILCEEYDCLGTGAVLNEHCQCLLVGYEVDDRLGCLTVATEVRQCGRSGFKKHLTSFNSFQSSVPLTTSASQQAVETFEEKNARLKRPLSPHLTIYKFQVTSVLSVTHRATGIALATGLYGLSLGTLLLPASFPYYFDALQSMHIAAPLIFSFKFALAWTCFYHSFNGIRHLAWDMGYGFDLKNLYLSGYIVLGTSLAASTIAALM